jgi:hypothetical protein
MTDTPTEIAGHCLCGNVSYRADAAPVVQAVCHCTECQRQTGTAFSVVVGVPRAALTIKGSSLASFTTVGEQHGTDTQRQFCSACGSPIVSFAEAMPEMAFIKAGTLDDASWIAPAVEVWTRSAQPWSPHFEQATQLARGPGAAA